MTLDIIDAFDFLKFLDIDEIVTWHKDQIDHLSSDTVRNIMSEDVDDDCFDDIICILL